MIWRRCCEDGPAFPPHSNLLNKNTICTAWIFEAICKDARIVAYITHATSLFVSLSSSTHTLADATTAATNITALMLNDDAPASTRARLVHTHSPLTCFVPPPYDIKPAPHPLTPTKITHQEHEHSPSPHLLFSAAPRPRCNISH
ncbi:uncharacterized protein TrAtP1_009595 [Trichoderma atroviride]|uniref:uncharacterized protein n=1 Tax=Hypocrea atroviridis TaxID=63577 RepID=UPI003320EEC7|nr:hypothetical protein TrAtP1_009595 [Trichoderma atroviride]